MTIYKTRYKELGYCCSTPGIWRFVDLTDGENKHVGEHYASKTELLANLQQYASEAWGLG